MKNQTYYGDGPVPLSDFPGAERAVELCEQLKHWDMYRNTAETEGLFMLRWRMQKSAENAMKQLEAAGESEKAEVIRIALGQWDHPNFSLYLKRKLW